MRGDYVTPSQSQAIVDSEGDARRRGNLSVDAQMRAVRRTPKRPLDDHGGRAAMFPYYAGFAFEWAVSELDRMQLKGEEVVLDPWNGSGTTTAAAAKLEVRSIGIDLNPVAVISANARSVSTAVSKHIRSLDPAARPLVCEPAPGSRWLAASSAQAFADIRRGLLQRAHDLGASDGTQSDLTSCILLASFRVVRRLTSQFEGSNPTWVKVPSPRSKLRPSTSTIEEAFRQELLHLAILIESEPLGTTLAKPALMRADSAHLPLPDSSVSGVITSPPYCTRIDYAVATSRELDALGLDDTARRSLRLDLLGTTLNRPGPLPNADFGPRTQALLDSIRLHGSRDAAGYYLKHYLQYFELLQRSIAEIARVTRPSSSIVMVVQDSYFYDVHVPLDEIVLEMADRLGIGVEEVDEVPVVRNLITLNTRARLRRGEAAKVAEMVIRMRRR